MASLIKISLRLVDGWMSTCFSRRDVIPSNRITLIKWLNWSKIQIWSKLSKSIANPKLSKIDQMTKLIKWPNLTKFNQNWSNDQIDQIDQIDQKSKFGQNWSNDQIWPKLSQIKPKKEIKWLNLSLTPNWFKWSTQAIWFKYHPTLPMIKANKLNLMLG